MPFIFLRSFYMIKREKIGLVHCQGRLSGILGYLLKKTAGVPYIITIQSADFSVYHPKANIKPIKWIYNFFRKKIYQNAVKCHAVSNYLGGHFRKYGIKDVTVIPNGVNQKDFKPDKNKRATRKELGLDTENLIICISRLESKNGTDDLVKAADVLKSKIKDFKIAIIGSGSQKKKLEKLIQNLGLRNEVVLLGEIPHGAVPKYLACADIFIRPSLAEGFGIVFIEAMACEVPVIGTSVGGIPDFIKDPSTSSGQVATGLFCEPGNPKSIAEKIETLIENKELRNTLVKNAKQMVVEVYNWDKISKKISRLYFMINKIEMSKKYSFTRFDKFLRHLRIRRVISYFKKNDSVLDIGCGEECALFRVTKSKIKRYHGIDNYECKLGGDSSKFNFSKLQLNKTKELPFRNEDFDKIVLLAVLEHLDNSELIIKESFRALKKGGVLLMTAPAPKAKPVLEFLAKFRIINPKMIYQHKNYFNIKDLRSILNKAGFEDEKIKINTFEFGFNTFVMAQK